MIMTLDKRTKFYYFNDKKQGYLFEGRENIPEEIENNKNVILEDFDVSDIDNVITDMFNKGITSFYFNDELLFYFNVLFI